MANAGSGPPPFITIPGPSGPDQGDAGDKGDPEQRIKDALDEIRSALSADGFSEQERLTLEKVTTLLQGLSASREKEQQAAMGASPAMNFLRRSSGGQSS